jgi:hypothetical protein
VVCILMCQEARQDVGVTGRGSVPSPGNLRKFSGRTSGKLSSRILASTVVIWFSAFPIRRICSFVWPACEMGVQGGHVSSQVNAPLLRTWRWDSARPANEAALDAKEPTLACGVRCARPRSPGNTKPLKYKGQSRSSREVGSSGTSCRDQQMQMAISTIAT